MIGVIPNETPEKPEITDQLALAAINLIKDYCGSRKCGECGIKRECEMFFIEYPAHWEV